MIDIRDKGADCTGVIPMTDLINANLLLDDVIIKNAFFLLDSSILIPSNRTLYIENSRGKSSDGMFDNVFRNIDLVGGNTNVNVIGIGCALIDENSVNNYSIDYTVYGGLGSPATAGKELYKANTFFFCNATQYKVEGLTIADRKHYVSFVHDCSYGTYKDLFFNFYSVTRNQDGIQTSWRSHHLTFDNINGSDNDSHFSVWLGTLRVGLSFPIQDHLPISLTDGDAHDLVWTNMVYETVSQIVFITGDGNQIYNCSGGGFKHIDGYFFMGFGAGGYNTLPPAPNDIRNIVFDDIEVVNIGQTPNPGVFNFDNNCNDITITNFVNNSGDPNYIINGGTPDNVTINGVLVT